MRGTMVACLVLALGACAEHTGWNPNYSLGDRPGQLLDEDTSYTRYLMHREAALQGKVEPTRTIPIARPFKAPTAEDIAGPNLWQIMQREARAATGSAAPRVAEAPAAAVRQGPYPGSTPVLARYAVQVTHAPGTRVWARAGADAAGALRICTTFATPDSAQTAFLARGGPQADPLGMDPDGDGLVCGWDPATWRQARR